MKRFVTLLALSLATIAKGQDIKGAYLYTKPDLNNITHSIVAVLFADSVKNINRTAITVDFGDGSSGNLQLSQSYYAAGILVKTYTGTHTYTTDGFYLIKYYDNFRVAGIKNMLNSEQQQVFVSAALNYNTTLGINCPGTVAYYPFSLSRIGSDLLYNAASYDCEGDSMSYVLVNCNIPGYYIPNRVSIDNKTGLFTFPEDLKGLYAFKFEVQEWRKDNAGHYVNMATTQMDFLVDNSEATAIPKTEFNPGELVLFPNPVGDELKIYATTGETDLVSIELYNAFGELVLKSDYTESLNVSALVNGIYMVKYLVNQKPVKNYKLIKN